MRYIPKNTSDGNQRKRYGGSSTHQQLKDPTFSLLLGYLRLSLFLSLSFHPEIIRFRFLLFLNIAYFLD